MTVYQKARKSRIHEITDKHFNRLQILNENAVLTLNEAAIVLKMCPKNVVKLIRMGIIKAIRLGKSRNSMYRIASIEIKKYLNIL